MIPKVVYAKMVILIQILNVRNVTINVNCVKILLFNVLSVKVIKEISMIVVTVEKNISKKYRLKNVNTVNTLAKLVLLQLNA